VKSAKIIVQLLVLRTSRCDNVRSIQRVLFGSQLKTLVIIARADIQSFRWCSLTRVILLLSSNFPQSW